MRPCFTTLSLLLVGLAGCDKKTAGGATGTSGTYKGVIIHNICCQVVIRTIGHNYLGQASWIDSNKTDHPVYEHVFKVANPCQFGTHVEGDTITFKVIAQQPQNCACCLLYVATPTTSYPIEVL